MLQAARDWLWVPPPHRPPYVVERGSALPGHRLGSLLGAEWYLSPYGWLAPVWVLGLGLLLAQRTRRGQAPAATLGRGLSYALLTALSMVWHQVGQIVGGRLVGAPLSGVVFTATLAYQLYPEEGEQPRHVHLARALGGPVAHLALGATALLVWRRRRTGLAGYLAALNGAFAAASLLPIPAMDGGVVLRELRRGRASR